MYVIYGFYLYSYSLETVRTKDLHSGNILYSEYNNAWRISDFGFCGPADKPLESIYGNLPYIAPEVINGKGYTFASDIYSVGMLMWEISSGQPPFAYYDHDYDLAINIIKGMRPPIVKGTLTEYKDLMVQCWDADPLKRLDLDTLHDKITKIQKSYYQNKNEENVNFNTNYYLIIDKNLERDIFWYQKAAGNDNNCIAFEFYKKKANQGCLKALYKGGYYYDNGIIIDVDKEKALELYKIAAKEGRNCNAQNICIFI
ncbi:9393_t:CDS:2 [Funneliformis geosporum]|nr:9393_t:CDS:2 [Funneliformis geosporum]